MSSSIDFAEQIQLDLLQMEQRVIESCAVVKENLSSFSGGPIPDWARRHIELHGLINEIINKMQTPNRKYGLLDYAIPRSIPQTMKKSREIIQLIRSKFNNVMYPQATLPNPATITYYGLLASQSEIAPSRIAWQLNLGLLMDAYYQTEDPKLKKHIQFLALNYLAKAAPARNVGNFDFSPEIKHVLADMFQFGLMVAEGYHREGSVYEALVCAEVDQTFASTSGSRFWLTETTKFQEILPTSFYVINVPKVGKVDQLADQWSKEFAHAMTDHLRDNPQDPFKCMAHSILFDFTDMLDDMIITNKNSEKEQIFEQKRKEIENALEEAINQTIDNLRTTYPNLLKTPDDIQKLKIYLKANLNYICRCNFKGLAILKKLDFFLNPSYFMLPESVFSDPDFQFFTYTKQELQKFRHPKTKAKFIAEAALTKPIADLTAFVNHAGIRIGAIRSRDQIFDLIDLRQLMERLGTNAQMTQYAVYGPNVIAFTRKDEILETFLFKRFKMYMSNPQLAVDKPQIAILGNATANLIQGLMNDISEEKWRQLNNSPATRMILQQSLFQLMEQLATAEKNMNDFTLFSQSIELIHCEIATILALALPYGDGAFQNIYKMQVEVLTPPSLRGHLKVGLTRSGMNAFAGIVAAVHTLNPNPEKVYSEGSYFEELDVIGAHRSVREILPNKLIPSVDLYLGQFSPNINVHIDFNHYTEGPVREEIEQLLNAKPNSHLTVAIDCTIDLLNSPKAKHLLEHFSKEIVEGRLNFIFFRSGQKFDMFGMDIYYGAPFWMVNNGGQQWKAFDQLMTSEAYQTDPLTIQWFCLVNRHAPTSVDAYKEQIFKNTRTVLSQVPAELRPGACANQQVRISTIDERMNPAFIDIKILSQNPWDILMMLENEIYKRFVEKGLKIHTKSSFGFYHLNWGAIASSEDRLPRIIRINPGLNQEENQILVDFLRDIPNIIARNLAT